MLLASGLDDIHVTDVQIAAAPPEDTLGVGFWCLAMPLLVVETVLLYVSFKEAPSRLARATTILVGLAFLAALVFAWLAYSDLSQRVFALAGLASGTVT